MCTILAIYLLPFTVPFFVIQNLFRENMKTSATYLAGSRRIAISVVSSTVGC
jgi:hypothetical protein